MRIITVEELDIVVQASVEQALTEFKRLSPEIKKEIKKITTEFNNADIKNIKANINMTQVTKEIKKVKGLIKETFNPNEVNFTVNGMKEIKGISTEFSKLSGKKIDLNNAVELNHYINKLKETESVANQVKKNISNIGYIKYDTQDIQNQINKYSTNGNNTVSIKPSTESLSLWDKLKQKIAQAKTIIEGIKKSTNSAGSAFKAIVNISDKVKNGCNQILKVTTKVTTKIKQMGTGFKQGLGHILKYAGALFSLQTVYSTLSSSANAWLSSQNKQAQQLQSNIDYLKYSMGSALAPVIEWVVGLVYQLMKAIQSVAYALTGVNIFANATADSYSSIASSAKEASKATKQLAGVHSDINNLSSNTASGGGTDAGGITPSFDLSKVDISNSLIDAIKKGNWNEIGKILAEKLNDAMNSIPWDKIQSTAQGVGENIANFLNGFIKNADWTLVGKTIAEGINTAIIFAKQFVYTFDWGSLGDAIGNSLNGLFDNIKIQDLALTLSGYLNGICTTASKAIKKFNWGTAAKNIANGINTYISNVKWGEMSKTLSDGIKSACEAASSFIDELDIQDIADAIVEALVNFDWYGTFEAVAGVIWKLFWLALIEAPIRIGISLGEELKKWIDSEIEKLKDPSNFETSFEDIGENMVSGLLMGILYGIGGIFSWLKANLVDPIVNSVKSLFGIHSPSIVFQGIGQQLVAGLLNGVSNIWGSVSGVFENLKNNIGKTFTEAFNKIKSNFSIENITKHFDSVVTSIKNIFKNIPNWFQSTFSSAWSKVKQVFSKGGKVFDRNK